MTALLGERRASCLDRAPNDESCLDRATSPTMVDHLKIQLWQLQRLLLMQLLRQRQRDGQKNSRTLKTRAADVNQT